MKQILITAYAINPYKGSEDGTGWNITHQLARYNKVTAITRKNNREAIEQFIKENPEAHFKNLNFEYYDLPYWMRFWKRKSRGALLYFYLWQFFLPIFVVAKGLKFDIAHGLNFHADWAPCFLWVLGKPFVWGPVGHHPPLPEEYARQHGTLWTKERVKWVGKSFFYRMDPFLWLTKKKADYLFAVNSDTGNVLRLNDPSKWKVLPAVGARMPDTLNANTSKKFTILSVGRFVPLKGFDLTVLAFAEFYHNLPESKKDQVTLQLIGKGPMKEELQKLITTNNLERVVQIIDWLPQSELFEAYQKADVFLFPSHEGAGMVVPEAFSYSLPVVCLDNFGPGELIDEESGVKIPYTNYQQTPLALAEVLEFLYQSPKHLLRLREGALRRYQQYFGWKVKGRLINEVYNEVSAKTIDEPTLVYKD